MILSEKGEDDLKKKKNADSSLNEKFEFSNQRVKFLGHIISENCIESGPKKKKKTGQDKYSHDLQQSQKSND